QSGENDSSQNGFNLNHQQCGNQFSLIEINFTFPEKGCHEENRLHSHAVKKETGKEKFQIGIFKQKPSDFEKFFKTLFPYVFIEADIIIQNHPKTALFLMFVEYIFIV